MIISNINRNRHVQTWFFRNKSEQKCTVQIYRLRDCSSGGAHSGTPAKPSRAWPTGHIRKITGISPSQFFFSNQISTKSTFGSRLKIVKNCYLRGSFDDVRHFFPLSPLFGIENVRFHEIFWWFLSWRTAHRRVRMWMTASTRSAENRNHRPALSLAWPG